MITLSQANFMSDNLDVGYTASVFPYTVEKLKDDDIFDSVIMCANRTRLATYRSLIDYIFCETWTDPWFKRCRNFYMRNGQSLLDDVALAIEEAFWHDIVMSRLIIEICRNKAKTLKPCRWFRIRATIRKCMVGTPYYFI